MKISTLEVRKKFIDFFKVRGHKLLNSSSLVLEEDSSLFFSNAGMNQFKDILLGYKKSEYSRVVTVQRCCRTGGKHNDLSNIGYSDIHHTFFEMLGNFSFGDYSKKEAILFAWELLTSSNWFNISKDRIIVTVHENDEETYNVWSKLGISNEHIIRIKNRGSYYLSDNFWYMGNIGPCGPCTEILFKNEKSNSNVSTDYRFLDKYIEIWNIVFVQFNRQMDGKIQSLPMLSVDTGMGLERITSILQQVNSNYEIDIFKKLISYIADIIGVSNLHSRSLRIISDHIRACSFLIADGVLPSSSNQGYVLRHLIRRIICHGNLLGFKYDFVWKLVSPLIECMGSMADTVKYKQKHIEQVIKNEEEHFAEILARGLFILNNRIKNLKNNILDGDTAFLLHDTFGFPIDLISDICYERNLKVDVNSFKNHMNNQRSRSRNINLLIKKNVVSVNLSTKFTGYKETISESIVRAILIENQKCERISCGQEGVVVLDQTPFFSRSGGQVSDLGVIYNNYAKFVVSDVQKTDLTIFHLGKLTKGCLNINDHVYSEIDITRRLNICLNHSATHLLHSALCQVLGEHISQKGSLVNDRLLRFDFSHTCPVTPEEITAIECIVNNYIRLNYKVITDYITLENAKLNNKIKMINKKYDDYVRTIRIGDFSTELCIGTHVEHTGNIGLFHIVNERGVSSGIRRIEALTGIKALELVHSKDKTLKNVIKLLKSDTTNVVDKLKSRIKYISILENKISNLQKQYAIYQKYLLLNKIKNINNINLVISKIDNADYTILHSIVRSIKLDIKSAVIVLGTIYNNKVLLVVSVTKDIVNKFKADVLLKKLSDIIGCCGGGSSSISQAEGGNIKFLSKALDSVESWIRIQC